MPHSSTSQSNPARSRNDCSRGVGRAQAALGLRKSQRKGAVFSIEMMMVISVLIPMMFALTEFSLLWSAKHLLQTAAHEAARAAAMPGNEMQRCMAAEEAVQRVIVRPRLQDPVIDTMQCDVGMYTGDYVTIDLQLPMTAASPDLLGIIGISIEGRFLSAQAVHARQ